VRSIARFVSARRTAWIALVLAASAVAALFAFLPKGEADAFPPSGLPESSQARQVSELLERFPSADTTVGILVFSRDGAVLEVNPTDMKAMEHLIQEGSLSPTELAGRLGISTAAATLVVDRLVAVGHVDRRPHPHDRRRVVVVPRPASVGRALDELMPMIGGVARAADALTERERATVLRFLGEVREVYREAAGGPDGAPRGPEDPPAARR
jgi:DNA-binding MarR family transcriptional regulator